MISYVKNKDILQTGTLFSSEYKLPMYPCNVICIIQKKIDVSPFLSFFYPPITTCDIMHGNVGARRDA